MTTRRGLGKGKGSGWKNIISNDPHRHGLAAKGVKTAALSPRLRKRVRDNPKLATMNFANLQKNGVFLKYQGDADKDGVVNIRDCQPLNRNKQDDTSAFKKASKDAKAQFAEGRSFGQIRESLITNPELDEGDIDMILSKVDTKAEKSPGTFDVGEITQPNKGVNDVGKIGASSKVEAFAKRAAEAGKKGFAFAKKEVAKYQKKQQEKKVKLLEKVKNPLAEKLIAQKKRVQELEKQISESQDSQQENKLFSELKEEENQLRELQEKVTDMKLQDFSDAELKTLAVRYQPDEGLLSGFFSTPSNPYEKELLRRIEKKEMLEKEITDTRKKAKSQESSGGGGFFGF